MPQISQPPATRQVICPRCGACFRCQPGAECWCAAEPFRMALPADASAAECLCADCLRAMVPPI